MNSKPKTSSKEERKGIGRPKTESQHKDSGTILSNEERVQKAKTDLNKITEELEAIIAERNKKKQILVNDFSSFKDNLLETHEETKNTKIDSKEENEEEIERRSKENLAKLERKLKALDAVKEETFNKLTAYINKIQTAKDENGELILKNPDKIDEIATIMKDYQREAWTSYDQNSMPGLIEERIRGHSAATVSPILTS
jgi:DNA repair exonuclease SbcCD ATPase subunit